MNKNSKLKINRETLNDLDLKHQSKWLYVVLSELELRLTKKTDGDSFYRSQEDLVMDTGLHGHTIKIHREKLAQAGYIKFWIAHRIDPTTKRKHRIMFYRVLK